MTRGRSRLQHGERRDEDPPLVRVRLDGRRQRAERRLRPSEYCEYSRPRASAGVWGYVSTQRWHPRCTVHGASRWYACGVCCAPAAMASKPL